MRLLNKSASERIKQRLPFVYLLSGLLLLTTVAPAQSVLEASRWMDQGHALRQAGWYDSSTQYLQKAADQYHRQSLWKNYIHSLTLISANYADLRELDQAQAYAQRAVSYSRRERLTQDTVTAAAYLALSSVMVYRRQLDSARVYHRAISHRSTPLPPVQRARAHVVLGRILNDLSRFDSAKLYYNKAIELVQKSPKTYPLTTADLYLRLGACYGNQRVYDTAMYYYRQSLAVLQRAHLTTHPLTEKVYTSMAVDFWNKSDLDQSLHYLLKALEIQKHFFGDNNRTADCYRNIGVVYMDKRAFARAHHYLQQSVSLLEGTGNQYSLVHAYQSLGTNANYSKNFSLGRAFLHRALDAWQGLVPPDSTLLCRIFNNLGLGYEQAGKLDSAMIYFRQALQVAQQLTLKDSANLAIYHHNVGNTYLDKGRFDSALGHARQALSIRQTIFGQKHAKTASCWTLLGEVYTRQGNKKLALYHLQRALAANVLDFSDTASTLNPSATSDYLDAYELLDALHYKAAVLLMHQPAVSEARRALSTLYLSDSIINQLQRTYQTHDDQVALKEQARHTYQLAVKASMYLFAHQNNPSYLHRAFYFCEKSKASVLTHALAELSAQHQAGLPDSILDQERTLSINRAYYTSQLQTEQSRTTADSAVLQHGQTRLFAINREYDSLIHLLETQYPRYYTLKYRNPVITVPKLQRQLPPSTTLVSSFLGDNTLYQFIITADTLRVTEQPYHSTLADDINQLSSTLTPEAITSLSQASYQTYTKSASSLYQTLLADALPALTDTAAPLPSRLIIVADGILGYVPYDLLLTQPVSSEVPDYRHLPYLLNDYDISYGYSATWLFQPLDNPPAAASQRLVAFASATLSPSAPADRTKLTWNQQEVNYVSDHLPSQSYTGAQAQESRFKAEADRYRFIHLAMHGYADAQDPLASKLIFSAQPDSTHQEDNILYAHELYDMQLSADLAVLSACQTGDGVVAEGEGILSLARAFAYAGCASVVMSHWAADDESTATLMNYFYEYLSEGQTKDEALSEAKRTFLAEAHSAYTHPYYWGNFVLVGDNEPITYPRNADTIYLLLGSIVLIVLAVMVNRSRIRQDVE